MEFPNHHSTSTFYHNTIIMFSVQYKVYHLQRFIRSASTSFKFLLMICIKLASLPMSIKILKSGDREHSAGLYMVWGAKVFLMSVLFSDENGEDGQQYVRKCFTHQHRRRNTVLPSIESIQMRFKLFNKILVLSKWKVLFVISIPVQTFVGVARKS